MGMVQVLKSLFSPLPPVQPELRHEGCVDDVVSRVVRAGELRMHRLRRKFKNVGSD